MKGKQESQRTRTVRGDAQDVRFPKLRSRTHPSHKSLNSVCVAPLGLRSEQPQVVWLSVPSDRSHPSDGGFGTDSSKLDTGLRPEDRNEILCPERLKVRKHNSKLLGYV